MRRTRPGRGEAAVCLGERLLGPGSGTIIRERLSDGIGTISRRGAGRLSATRGRCMPSSRATIVSHLATSCRPDEEGVELLGTMVAYAGTFSLGENVVVHHIDTSVEPGLDRNRPNPSLQARGRHADDHHRALQKLPRRNHGSLDPRMEKGAVMARASRMRGAYAMNELFWDRGEACARHRVVERPRAIFRGVPAPSGAPG